MSNFSVKLDQLIQFAIDLKAELLAYERAGGLIEQNRKQPQTSLTSPKPAPEPRGKPLPVGKGVNPELVAQRQAAQNPAPPAKPSPVEEKKARARAEAEEINKKKPQILNNKKPAKQARV